MKHALKSYLAFTSFGYRMVMLLLIPVLTVLINVLGFWAGGELGGMAAMLTGSFLLLGVDIFSDKWVLNGFYAKSNSALEFLQTSNQFKGLIQNVVIVDIIRRLLLHVGIYAIALLVGEIILGEVLWYALYAYLPFMILVISMVTVWFTRHFTSIQSLWISSCIATTAASIGMIVVSSVVLVFDSVIWNVVLSVILMVLAVLIGMGTVWYSLKKVRDSYYDK